MTINMTTMTATATMTTTTTMKTATLLDVLAHQSAVSKTTALSS